ncbi:MAG: ATP-binding protein [Verrucomicrobia bacterium]|nr:ATP-binding protein [Verrucomicrobiota bacterium]
MAKTNRERIDEGLQLLAKALRSYVERELKQTYGKDLPNALRRAFAENRRKLEEEPERWDTQFCLSAMIKFWGDTFQRTLGGAERSLVHELIEVRNAHAHEQTANFTYPDTHRALDSMMRLATAISSPEAETLNRMASEVLRLQFDEQARWEKRKASRSPVKGQPSSNLKPWRDVVSPHSDVAKGNYKKAEFAADLWQVYCHPEETSPEYGDPVEFFRRTYITSGLKQLLSSALKRLSGGGGDPVTQLQTNFGGGKTHSMLALYHLCSGHPLTSLPGMEPVLEETRVSSLPPVKCAVLVGTRLSPGDPIIKEDGTEVRTLWGEMAWQLGGRKGYDLVAKADLTATNPNDESLRKLFKDYGPVMILIDEWVAYARQLHDEADLPAGSFDTQFTFAQALTEVVSTIGNALLVVSLPASDSATASPGQDESNLIEVGGQRGQEALRRLRNVVGRKDSPWRAATQEESYEIVRRRLFNPIASPELYKHRDTVARAFVEMYAEQKAEFPADCRRGDYETRIKNAYPIHPELFDRLYTDWASLIKFQRTRGVLRLMAAVVHSLWESNDSSLLILPALVPIETPTVQNELTRYLDENWVPVIEKDIDGANSVPLQIDRENTNLGRYSASRRVARTIFLGSAPTLKAAHSGLDEQHIKLGCSQPGETVAIFTDALKKLANLGTFLYEDGSRYKFSTSPSLNSVADQEAQRFREKPDLVMAEIVKFLEVDLDARGDFKQVHLAPESTDDIPDELATRLVVLGPDYLHSKGQKNSPAMEMCRKILAKRGNRARSYTNTLVFVAADATRFDEFSQSVRLYMAWKRILEREEELDLTRAQRRHVDAKVADFKKASVARLSEAYCWLITPSQDKSDPKVEWQDKRIQGPGHLAERVAAKLKLDDLLRNRLAPSTLRIEMDNVPLWRGKHVAVRKLVDDFAKYLYLPRLTAPHVLMDALVEGVTMTSWQMDGFAYADSYDEELKRYRGLTVGKLLTLDPDDHGLIVKPDVASEQMEKDAEAAKASAERGSGREIIGRVFNTATEQTESETPAKVQPKHYHGRVELDSMRISRDAARIAEEVVRHLTAKIGASVQVSLEIQAEIPDGIDEATTRTITENSRTLKFRISEFES